MRLGGWGLFIVGLIVAAPEPALAGIYNPGETEEAATYPDFIDSPMGRNFREVVLTLRSISVTQAALDDPLRPRLDNPVRRRYVFLEELLGKSGASHFKTEELLQGSAVLMRRGKFKQAELLLRPMAVARPEMDNIPIQSNFATALHLGGDLRQAYETLRAVVGDHWKQSWGELSDARRGQLERIGWSEPIYELNREYDTYYLKLLKLRLFEKVKPKGAVQLPDALFDDKKFPPSPVRFVNDAGEFEAGRMAAAERAKLPPKALAIVQQLIVWMPDDLRLYWLLGELYNVQKGGDENKEYRAGILAALQIFTELSAYEPIADNLKSQLKTRIGILQASKERFDQEDQDNLNKSLNKIETANAGFSVDWRTVAISFALGFVLAFFAIWQMREIRRRHQSRAIAK